MIHQGISLNCGATCHWVGGACRDLRRGNALIGRVPVRWLSVDGW